MVFKPGQSGNPGGRPREEMAVIQLAKQNSEKAILKLVELIDSEDPKVSIAASNAVLDRAIGKPKQALEHSGPEGEKLVIQIVRLGDNPAS